MARSDIFFKVELEHEAGEDVRKLAREIARQILKTYGVRSAEMTNYVLVSED